MQRDDEYFRAPLVWLLAPYVAGLLAACAGWGGRDLLWAAAASVSGLVAVILAGRDDHPARPDARAGWMIAVVAAAFLGGMIWMHAALASPQRWRTLPPREATLEVELTRVFPASDVTDRRSCLARVIRAPDIVDDLVGQRLFFAALAPTGTDLVTTMQLYVRGVLQPLEAQQPPAGSFEAYLVSSAVHFKLTRATVLDVLATPRPLPAFWHRLGLRFERILRHGLPPDHPATGAHVAMFLGRKSELGEDQREAFLRSGTMHLFAISGLHIAAIAYCLRTLLQLVRLRPLAAFLVGLALLTAFVEATGGTPSARRALFMIALLWAGEALRRPANPLAALAAAALGVLLVDPLALLSSSFQLSYAVVAAILVYGVPLRNRLVARWRPFALLPDKDWRWWHHAVFDTGRKILEMLAISIAATLVSLPLGVGIFGLGSPGAILSNLLLIPPASLAVTAGFISLTCGLLGLLPVSAFFNHAAAMTLWIISTVADIAARLPGMYFEGRFGAAWIAAALVVGMLSVCVAGYATLWKRPRGALFVPPAAVGVALVLLVTPPPPGQQSADMKSAYELAMERLQKSDPDASPKLTSAQKEQLAEIDRVYQGKIAEREIFLKQRLAEAVAAGQAEEAEKIRQQTANERARLEEEREDAKNRVRRGAGK